MKPETAAAVLAPTDRDPIGTPFPGPQVEAYLSPADELFFGGGGGGGKTYLIELLACNAHLSTMIFRRQAEQLGGPEGIIATARRLIGSRGRVTADGAVIYGEERAIEWGGLNQADDWEKYKGRAHDLLCFDEISEFLEGQYRALQAWVRTAVPGQRVRTVCTGNPPTSAEGGWVIAYWAPWLDPHHPNPAKPGELRWFATVKGKDIERPNGEIFEVETAEGLERIKPRSRTFIRSLVEDNPAYMATGYDTVLNSLPEPLRSQMRWGKFDADATDDPWQVIPTAWVRAAQARWTEAPPLVKAPGAQEGDPLVPHPLTALGADISRGGRDKTTIATRRGAWVGRVEKHPGATVPDGLVAAQLLLKAAGGDTVVPVQIDVIGIGASAYDQAKGLGLRAVALNGSEKSEATDRSGKLRFANKRAEWHWTMREVLDPLSGMDVALPPDTELLADLCAPRWRPSPQGVRVELKEDIKARIGRSPDTGEAVINVFARDGDQVWLEYARQVVEAARRPAPGGTP